MSVDAPKIANALINPSAAKATGSRLLSGTHTPKFGLSTAPLTNAKLALSAKTLFAAENIVETFLWGFLGLDVLGMWLPRIKVSLTRGAIPYDVREDPEMKGKPLHQQVKKSIVENIKGFNWVNFYEEAGREFATGPGMLMVPALALLVGKRVGLGGDAIKLSSAALKAHGQAFAENLGKLSPTHLLNRSASQSQDTVLQAYRQQVKNHLLHDVFKDDDFFRLQVVPHLKAYRGRLPQSEQEQLDRLMPIKNIKTGKDYLDRYLTQWSDKNIHIGPPSGDITRRARADMKPIQAELHDLMVDKFNENSQLAKKLQALRNGANTDSLKLMGASEVNILGQRVNYHHFMGSRNFQGTLEKLSHLYSSILSERLAHPNVPVGEVAGGVTTRLSAKKGIVQWLTAAVDAAYVIWLSFIIQRHNQYPGERLAHLEQKKKNEPGHHDVETDKVANKPASPFSIGLKGASV